MPHKKSNLKFKLKWEFGDGGVQKCKQLKMIKSGCALNERLVWF